MQSARQIGYVCLQVSVVERPPDVSIGVEGEGVQVQAHRAGKQHGVLRFAAK